MEVQRKAHGHAATHQLDIQHLFEGLTPREKLYAHYLSQAAWQGARVILRQTSPEGPGILDFILTLYNSCKGEWSIFVDQLEVEKNELDAFLEFSGLFLSNMGNYFGEGDRKVVPGVSAKTLRQMASISPRAAAILETVIPSMLSEAPASLGFPDASNQSNYYPGEERITRKDLAAVAKVMETYGIEPENTRVRRMTVGDKVTHRILQASEQIDIEAMKLDENELGTAVVLERGDHAVEMASICSALEQARKHVARADQSVMISHYIDSFRQGSMHSYRKAQKEWVSDVSPRIEHILGFVEPYRDPYGVRAEWEGVVAISDPSETRKLKALVDDSDKYIRMMPWAVPGENDGKGPFEPDRFRAPNFTIVHALTFCASYVWEAVNLPNYSDIRETYGSKNILFANRMNTNNNPNRPCYFVRELDAEGFNSCNHIVRFVVTAIHEVLGHGAGKLLTETRPGEFNFDKAKLPIDPLTGKAVETWHRQGQTWTSVFEKLATSVEECRAMLVSYYLSDDKAMLSTFGFDDTSALAADDLTYFTYLHVGVEGLQALRTFNAQDQTWGQPHARANFAILKHLLLDGNGVMTVKHDLANESVHIEVDRSRITSHGKPSLGRMLCRLHVWRCTANVQACRDFYDPLCVVDGDYEVWRRIVESKPEQRWKFVQANTILKDGQVSLRVYEESNEGIIQSFAERALD